MILFRDNIIEIVEENPDIKTVIFDRDATLLNHGKPINNANKALVELVKMGKKVVILTNSGNTEEANIAFLSKEAGLKRGVHYHEVLSSGDILKEEFAKPGFADKKFLVLGNIRDESIFANKEQFITAKNDGDFVNTFKKENIDYFFIGFPQVNGKYFPKVEDFTCLCDFIALAQKPIYAGFADVGGADKDGNPYIVQGDVLIEIRNAQEFFGSYAPVTVYGKPETKWFLNLFKEKLPGFNPKEALMVGDNPKTDIAFGRNMGMQTVYVSTFPRRDAPRIGYAIPSVSGHRYGMPINLCMLNRGREPR